MTEITRKGLKINLSDREIKEEPVSEKVANDFIGGRGFGIYYLYRDVLPNTDPLGADNKLLLVTGPLAGTNAQAVSRWMVCTRSPLTGAFARSVCGADFGAWMRFAGYDFILNHA
jgi:aldehyde:ferredoxin oxidoreductase